MSSRFTDEQLAALQADGKVIVSASAGSGKTTVMIEKIIRLIKDDKLGVDELLAVTFTKKAASQMKEKLTVALMAAINEAGVDEQRRKALKEQLAKVSGADISTIHSFCAKLIRAHFFAAGVENTFRVIGSDDAEGVALKNEALDDLLEEGYESKDEDFAWLLSLYWRKKSDNTLRKIITESYEKLRNRADYREYLAAIKGYD
ncbi:MAG: UvrD-helicase domain-containing protein, partial [Clostridia bacterium]|nr:UvrD-helicase domain-containing protein [Clostridia bacterium]